MAHILAEDSCLKAISICNRGIKLHTSRVWHGVEYVRWQLRLLQKPLFGPTKPPSTSDAQPLPLGILCLSNPNAQEPDLEQAIISPVPSPSSSTNVPPTSAPFLVQQADLVLTKYRLTTDSCCRRLRAVTPLIQASSEFCAAQICLP